jgi:hypothetical protein
LSGWARWVGNPEQRFTNAARILSLALGPGWMVGNPSLIGLWKVCS